jgi:hypothetical protein
MPNVLQRLMRRLFGGGETSPPPVKVSEEVALKGLQSFIIREVAGGFTPTAEIAGTAVEYMVGEADEAVLRREAPRMVQEALKAHQTAQASWPDVTDYDKLDAAFAALEASGVISRQNFACCGTCGAAEIWLEIDDAKRLGRPARGYAFFHQQDTEAAVVGDGLYLNYGACEDTSEAIIAVGQEIVQALEVKGLKTDWDGQLEKRIGVQMDWKRRTMFIEG